MSCKKVIKIVTTEEYGVWKDMKAALKRHNGYTIRKKYWPNNMSNWEMEHAAIEESYKSKLRDMIKSREQQEQETHARKIKKETEQAAAVLTSMKTAVLAQEDVDYFVATDVKKNHSGDAPSLNTSIAKDVINWNADKNVSKYRRSARISSKANKCGCK